MEIGDRVHVLSGTGPSQGKLFKLRQAHPLEARSSRWIGVMTTLTRGEGAEPFRLEADDDERCQQRAFPGCPAGLPVAKQAGSERR